ncbi:hypothetical protein ACWGA9_43380 [Streptomyces sp. NPDC054950]
MSESATDAGKTFAWMLREVMDRLAQRGMTQRSIHQELGEGFNPTALSKMIKADKLPTPEQLRRLLLLAEVAVGRKFPPAARERLETANLSALQAAASPVLPLLAAQAQVRRLQEEAQACRAREASAEKQLDEATRALRDMQVQLTRSRGQLGELLRGSQARLEDASARHDREQQQAERDLAAHRATIADLERGSERLAARIEQLQNHVRSFQVELEDTRHALVAALQRAEEAERSASQHQIGLGQMGQEVSVLTDLLEQARAELAELKREHAVHVADSDVLAEAESVVRKAQHVVQPEPAGAPGSGSGVVSAGETTLSPVEMPGADLVRRGRSDSSEEVALLTQMLATNGELESADALMQGVAERPVAGIIAVMDALGDVGSYRQREQLTRKCARQGHEKVAELLLALHGREAASEAGWLIDEAARRPASVVKELVALLLQQERRAYARRLLDETLPRVTVSEVAEIIAVLQQAWPTEAVRLVQEAAARRHARDLVVLLTGLSPGPADAALETASRRPAAVVAEALALLNSQQADSVTTRLSRQVASTSATAEVAALATALDAHGLATQREQLLATFLEQQSGQDIALLEAWHAAGELHGAAAECVLRMIGQAGSPADLSRVARFLRAHDAPDTVLLTRAVHRPPDDLTEVLARLAEAHAALCVDVLQHVVKLLPAADAVDVIERCLRRMLPGVRTTDVVAAATTALHHALDIAAILREREWLEEASHVVQTAGSRAARHESDLIEYMRSGPPSWVLIPLLTGLAQSPPPQCRAVISAMKASGLDGYVRLMLEYGPPADAVPLLSACLLEDAALTDYAAALHTRFVRTGSPKQLAAELPHFPTAVVSELITLAGTSRTAPDIADLIFHLSRNGQGRETLALLHAVGQGSPARADELARLLSQAGRKRQSAWLTQQAGSGRRDLSLPPTETVADALATAHQLYDGRQINAVQHVLEGALDNGADAQAIANHLSLPLLEHYATHLLAGRDRRATHALPSTADDLRTYLSRITANTSLRLSLVRWAMTRAPAEECAAILRFLQASNRPEEWHLGRDTALRRADVMDCLIARDPQLARSVAPPDAETLLARLEEPAAASRTTSSSRALLLRLAVAVLPQAECVRLLRLFQESSRYVHERELTCDLLAVNRPAAEVCDLASALIRANNSRSAHAVLQRAIAHHPLESLALLVETAFTNKIIPGREELDALLAARDDGPIAVGALNPWITRMYGP